MLTGMMEGRGLVLQTGAGGLAQFIANMSKSPRTILFIKIKYDLTQICRMILFFYNNINMTQSKVCYIEDQPIYIITFFNLF